MALSHMIMSVNIKVNEFILMEFFLIYFVYLFSETGKGKEKEGEKHQWVASHTPPTRDLDSNPAMCPDRESNL